MKRVCLDTNFIIDYLFRDEYKDSCNRMLTTGRTKVVIFYVSFLSLANFAYIMRRHDRKEHERHLHDLCDVFEVAANDSTQILNALKMDWKDFEDSLQYQTAMSVGCDCIVTRNKKDFNGSSVPVLTAPVCLSRLITCQK